MSDKSSQVSTNPVFLAIVGAIVSAMTTIFINVLLSGRINYPLVSIISISAIIVVLVIYWFYQRYFGFPFKKWYVTKVNIDRREKKKKSLSTSKEAAFEGRSNRDTWIFKAATATDHKIAVYGPYLKLREGSYSAKFRIKVDHISDECWPIINLEVASRTKKGGATKRLAGFTVTTTDFPQEKTFNDFSLNFYVADEEDDVEFRIQSRGSDHLVTLAYIDLSRKGL